MKAFLQRKTPDLIIKSSGQNSKPLLLDVYIGNKPLCIMKGVYRELEYFFQVYIITPANYKQILPMILPVPDVGYLNHHFNLFLTEYHYWMSCLKLKENLFNEKENVPIKSFVPPSVEFESNRQTFVEKLTAYARTVLEKKSFDL